MEASANQTVEWKPGSRILALWNIFGIGLTLLGLFIFGNIYAISRGEASFNLYVSASDLLLMTVVFLLLIVLHEWVHGRTLARFGARPKYGVIVLYKILPLPYCTAPGYRLDRSQFAIVGVAPALLISLVGALLVVLMPYGCLLVVPLAIHLGGCIGDLWFLTVIFCQPRGTFFEDLKTAVRIYRPPYSSVLDLPEGSEHRIAE